MVATESTPKSALKKIPEAGLKFIKYRGGYKYQLDQNYYDIVSIKPAYAIETDFISLHTNGSLFIRKGYAWDGPSGWTIDTKSSMRASMVHDAMYQLIRMGYLKESDRILADMDFHERCIEDKMFKIRARFWYRALRLGAGPAADPKNRKKVHRAPRTP